MLGLALVTYNYLLNDNDCVTTLLYFLTLTPVFSF